MKRLIPIIVVFFAVALWSCKKSEEFVNPVFMCECGTLNWGGEAYPLLMAEYVLVDSNEFSRKYFLTADIRTEDEILAHNLNFSLQIDSLYTLSYFVPDEDVRNTLEDVNLNESTLTVRNYTGVNGNIILNSSFTSGSEAVAFEFEMREVVNGDTVGLPIPFSGSFNLNL